jgi:hypothetical protein
MAFPGRLGVDVVLIRSPFPHPADVVAEEVNRLDPERETRRLIAKLEALGHTVTLDPAA